MHGATIKTNNTRVQIMQRIFTYATDMC